MADSVFLGKGFTTVDDCEDAWNESVDANVTATADGSDKVVGTASAKFVIASGASAGSIMATEVVSSSILGAGLWMWVKSSVTLAAGDFQILLDDTALCVSPHETLNIPAITTANQWQRVYMPFANPASTTAVISIGLKMVVDKTCTIWLDSIEQATFYAEIPILSVMGVNHPEGTEAFASQETDLLDGTIYQNAQYIRRAPVVHTQRLTPTQEGYVNDWWVSNDQELLWENEGIKVARGQARFDLVRANGIRYARMAILTLRERRVWLGRPTRWTYNIE